MQPLWRPALLALAVSLAASSCARASDAAIEEATGVDLTPTSTRWRFSGFGTLAWTEVDVNRPWGFTRDLTQPAEAESGSLNTDSRLGVQADLSWNTRWEALVQVLAKRRSGAATHMEKVSWAYVGYRWSPQFTTRLGRVTPDVFLQSESRDVGFGQILARPNREFYGWVPVFVVDGLDLSSTWEMGEVSWKGTLVLGRSAAHGDSTANGEPYLASVDQLVAASMEAQSGGLTLKLSGYRGQVSLSNSQGLTQLRDALQRLASLGIPGVQAEVASLDPWLGTQTALGYIALGMMYDRGPLWVHSEVSRVHGGWLADGLRGTLAIGHRWGPFNAYVAAGRSLPRLSLAPTSTDWRETLLPVLGATDASAAASLIAKGWASAVTTRFDQSSVSLGFRYDLSARLALKAQLDRIQVHPNGSGGWRNGDQHAGLARVASVQLDFVF